MNSHSITRLLMRTLSFLRACFTVEDDKPAEVTPGKDSDGSPGDILSCEDEPEMVSSDSVQLVMYVHL